MNAVDLWLMSLMTRIAGHSPVVTQVTQIIVNMYLVKGTILISLLWWIWFRRDDATADQREAMIRDREIVVIGIASGLVALVAGRLLAHYLPFRLRPIYEPQL